MLAKIVDINLLENDVGSLGYIQNGDIPFDIKRIYYIKNVPTGFSRGRHGHKELQQLIIAVNGSFSVKVIERDGSKNFSLSQANKGLFLPKMAWRELFDFSEDAICLVLASEKYDPNDYVHDVDEFSVLMTNS
jgi:dTDP-4-dehydrorhamnose 3,5-epimerase-like enzyme